MADQYPSDGTKLDIKAIFEACVVAARATAQEIGKGPSGSDMTLIAAQVGIACLRLIRDMDTRISELEGRVDGVKGFEYRDVWSAKEIYQPGDFVTFAGGLWGAKAQTQSRPGTDTTWRLAVKRGKDAKP